jgi:hypothetical protein
MLDDFALKTGGEKFTDPLSAARGGVVLWVSRRKPRVKRARERARKKRRHFHSKRLRQRQQ